MAPLLADLTNIFTFEYLAPLGVDLLIFMVLALSLNLINGCAGMFSLGHQGFFGVGAYVGGITVIELLRLGVPGAVVLVAAVLAGGIAATIFGLIVGIPCLRLKGDYLAIATLGFAEIFRITMINTEYVNGARGLNVPYVLFTRGLSQQARFYGLYLALAGGLVALTYLVIRNIMRSSHGRAIYAIREDEVAAELLGVDLTRYKVAVFAIGAGFAGLAGGLFANARPTFSPETFNLSFGVVLLLYVVLGGLGSMGGCIVATAGLFALERGLALAQDTIGTWWQVAYALLLVVIVLARPQGIAGKKSV